MPGSPDRNDTSPAPKLRVRIDNSLGTSLLSLDLEPFPSASENSSGSTTGLFPSLEDASSVVPKDDVGPSASTSDFSPEAVRPVLPLVGALPAQRVDFALRSAEINRRLFPARGLLGSLVLHGLAVFALIFFRPVFYTS